MRHFYPPNWEKFKTKAVRFLIPFFVMGFAFTLYMKPEWDANAIINSHRFLLSGAKNGYWYLWTLTVFYSTLLFLNASKHRGIFAEIGIAAIFFAIFYACWLKCKTLSEMLSFEHAVCFYPFFMLGYWTNRYSLVDKVMKRNWVFTIALIGYLLLMNVNLDGLPHIIGSMLERYLTPLCAIVVCVTAFARREHSETWVERQLAYLGRDTLCIYVLHYFIIYRINLNMLSPYFEHSNNTASLWLLTLLISIIFAYASVAIGKVLKTSDFAKRWIFGER